MKNRRRERMKTFILNNDFTSMEMLESEFDVSINTIRSDIKYLTEKFPMIRKTYGGVTNINSSIAQESLTAFSIRNMSNLDAKKDISKYAATFVEDDDVIFLDSGTTLLKLIDYVDPSLHFTIITYSVGIINVAFNYPQISVVSLGGLLNHQTGSFLDTNSADALDQYNIDKAFISATAVTKSADVANSTFFESEIKKKAISKSHEKYLLIDNTKFNASSLRTFSSLKDFTMIITDKKVPENIKDFCLENDVQYYETEENKNE